MVINKQKYIIFSHDVNQKLNHYAEEVVTHIQNIANNHSLTTKVRHNKNLISFTKKFFDLNKIKRDELSKDDYKNILFYFTKYLFIMIYHFLNFTLFLRSKLELANFLILNAQANTFPL